MTLLRGIMHLAFKRKLTKSYDNKAAALTIPRAIAQAWENYEKVEMIFDGSCLVITPYTPCLLED
jgi:virulence-associated protein VagC